MYIETISGEKCPKGGLWKVVGGHEYITIKKGDEMPNYGEKNGNVGDKDTRN